MSLMMRKHTLKVMPPGWRAVALFTKFQPSKLLKTKRIMKKIMLFLAFTLCAGYAGAADDAWVAKVRATFGEGYEKKAIRMVDNYLKQVREKGFDYTYGYGKSIKFHHSDDLERLHSRHPSDYTTSWAKFVAYYGITGKVIYGYTLWGAGFDTDEKGSYAWVEVEGKVSNKGKAEDIRCQFTVFFPDFKRVSEYELTRFDNR
jgi:hypothetical protein